MLCLSTACGALSPNRRRTPERAGRELPTNHAKTFHNTTSKQLEATQVRWWRLGSEHRNLSSPLLEPLEIQNGKKKNTRVK